jgi:hypothetical protein
MASQPGLLAFAMTIVLSVVCSIGVRESTMLNNALTAINLAVILFVICAGSRYANADNFTPFAPFGVSGIFTGAATAFYSYVGFDVIATSAEEAKNPSRNIPIAIIASLCICMGFYMAVAAVITLMIPYAQIDTTAPLSQAFAHYGATWAKYIIDVGAICGLSTSLMVSALRCRERVCAASPVPRLDRALRVFAVPFQARARAPLRTVPHTSRPSVTPFSFVFLPSPPLSQTSIFPMPRIVYAIANDGLLPPWIGAVHPWFKTPVTATMICGTLAGVLALIFDLNALADMMYVGTLMSYTLVAASVLVLRYREHDEGTLARLGGGEVRMADDAATAAATPSEGAAEERAGLLKGIAAAAGHAGVADDGEEGSERTGSGTPSAGARAGADGLVPGLLTEGGSAGARGCATAAQGGTPSASSAPSASTPAAASAGGLIHRTGRVSSSERPLLDEGAAQLLAGAGAAAPAVMPSVDKRRGFGGLAVWGVAVLPRWQPGHASIRMWRSEGWSSYAAASAQLGVYATACVLASVGVAVLQTQTLSNGGVAAMYVLIAVGAAIALLAAIAMSTLPQAIPAAISFTTPLAPYLPLVSVAVNIYLLVSLHPFTWVRFSVWCFIGTCIYVFYGIRHSKAVVAVTRALLVRPGELEAGEAAVPGSASEGSLNGGAGSSSGAPAALHPLEFKRSTDGRTG